MYPRCIQPQHTAIHARYMHDTYPDGNTTAIHARYVRYIALRTPKFGIQRDTLGYTWIHMYPHMRYMYPGTEYMIVVYSVCIPHVSWYVLHVGLTIHAFYSVSSAYCNVFDVLLTHSNRIHLYPYCFHSECSIYPGIGLFWKIISSLI